MLHFISVALHMSTFHLTFNFCAFHFAKGHINSCPLDQSPIEQKVEKPEELLRCTGHSLDDSINNSYVSLPEGKKRNTITCGSPNTLEKNLSRLHQVADFVFLGTVQLGSSCSIWVIQGPEHSSVVAVPDEFYQNPIILHGSKH